MFRYKVIVFILMTILLLRGPAFSVDNFFDVKQNEQKYQTVISTMELANPVFEKMRGYLYYNLGLSVNYPYLLELATPEFLDQITPVAYKKVEIGLYQFEGNYHHIYILNNLAVDDFLGTAAHEFTHAWQKENCPSNQNLILKEGFADWVAYKVLQFDGAVNSSQGIFYRADPVYGQGFKIMLQIEDQQGIQGVINYAKTTVN